MSAKRGVSPQIDAAEQARLTEAMQILGNAVELFPRGEQGETDLVKGLLRAARAGDAVIVADSKLIILAVNAHLETMWGHTQAELRGRPTKGLLSTDSGEELLSAVGQLTKGESAEVRLDLEGRRPDGSAFLLQAIINTIHVGKDRFHTLICRAIGHPRQLVSRLRQLERALEVMQLGVTIVDTDRNIIYVNPAEAEMHGYAVDEVLGRDVSLFAPRAAQRPMSLERLRDMRRWRRESVNVRKDGSTFPVEILSDVIAASNGEPSGVVSICQDITERKRAEEALRVSEERYSLAVAGANDGIWDWDIRENSVHFSPRWKSILGYGEDDIGDKPEDWFNLVHPQDLELLKHEIEMHLAGDTSQLKNEHRAMQKDGSFLWVLSKGTAVRDEKGTATRMVGSLTDISDRKLLDPLTGLPNRELLLDRVGHAMARLKRRPDLRFAVFSLDLDRFKLVNDSLGHRDGDQLLAQVARQLEGCTRLEDTIARLGGDEFAVVVEGVNDERQAVQVADRFQRELARPFSIGNQELFISASIGVVLSSPEYRKAEEIIGDAGIAMDQAKSRGRACFQIFDRGMREQAVFQLHLEQDLKKALELSQFRLHYQPIAAVDSGRIVGFEALLRWQHPSRGLLLPGSFLDFAEDMGLIIPLGRWILREACRQARQWQLEFPREDPLTISVNISPRQFSQLSFVKDVEQVLEETGLSSQYLNLEITENTVVADLESSLEVLKRLRDLGIRVSIDDFGTGYSPLSYLTTIPVDFLKIDRSFIGELEGDTEKWELVSTIIRLARSFKIHVVAEGVELAGQLNRLRDLECPFAQGYFLSRPVEPRGAGELLRHGSDGLVGR